MVGCILTIELDLAFFRSLADCDAANARVQYRLSRMRSGEDMVRFFAQYASWNGCFANGVAALASLIGDSRQHFQEAGFARATADRSNYVASFIFDAARDEYDDHISPMRDTHRCMAQASLISMADFYGLGDDVLNEPDPVALSEVNDAVMFGYRGRYQGSGGAVGEIFSGMGYHLGSELLADREFSLIDEHLRGQRNDLVQHLMRSTIELAGGKHRCYAWVGVHSGHGGAVEADHFEFAVSGVKAGLQYLVGSSQDVAISALTNGFRAFAEDHRKFFLIGAN
jgi:hypothetical protein